MQVVECLSFLCHQLLVAIGLICYQVEHGVDVYEFTCACFDVLQDLSRINPFGFDLFFIYLPQVFLVQIALITYKNDWYKEVFIFTATVVVVWVLDAFYEVILPYFYTFVAFLVGYVEDDDTTVGPAVKGIT